MLQFASLFRAMREAIKTFSHALFVLNCSFDNTFSHMKNEVDLLYLRIFTLEIRSTVISRYAIFSIFSSQILKELFCVIHVSFYWNMNCNDLLWIWILKRSRAWLAIDFMVRWRVFQANLFFLHVKVRTTTEVIRRKLIRSCEKTCICR